MGSFSEVVLALRFRADTPPVITGAFKQWLVTDRAIAHLPPSEAQVPDLPNLDEQLDAERLEELDLFFDDYVEEDDLALLSLVEQAVGWRWWCSFPEMSFPGTATVQLRWDPFGKFWSLTVRSYPKASSEQVCTVFASLAAVAEFDPSIGEPFLIGYVRHEYDARPTLIWHVGADRFVFEDLRELPLPPELRVDPPPPPPMSPQEWADLQEGIERLRKDLGISEAE